MPGKRRYSLVVEPLFFGAHHLGFVLFEMGPREGGIYEALRGQLSSALEGALLVQRKVEQEKERERLLADLESQMRALELAQARLVQSEKLAAIGELVAGVAHELNNPLTSIIGYAQLMQLGQMSDQARQDLGKIVAQSRRAAGIVRSLLDFARQRPSERKPVQVNDILISTLELLAYELRTHNIEWAVQLSPDLPLTLADPYQLQRVFVNLVHNARQAMNETQAAAI